jgi:glycosyltransferase involved in cell wall biosynthesis
MEDTRKASVSVVIPTRNRPAMVVAAVESALAQTEGLLEVIVVIDGLDPSTVAALALPQADSRVRVLALDVSLGGAEARNHGVRQARGNWVAFLDDDDLWLPQKLSVQLGLAKRNHAQNLVIASAVVARGPAFQAIWPRRLYRSGESMAEYLFCREGWTYGAALLQTSTLLAPRELLLRVPFAAGLKKHQDWDWLLRVSAEPGIVVLQSPEPLVIFHVEGNRASVGRAPDWQFSLAWAQERRALFTPRAFSAFLATECAPQAARAGATLGDRMQLLRAVIRQGSPTLKLCLFCVVFLLVPQTLRRTLRNSFRALRNPRLEPAPHV